jgi:LPS sulfotransferase NodH
VPRLPDFIGVGPPRTATTWLHQALKGRAGLPEATKETNFFLFQYQKGLEWYASMFPKCAQGTPIGEFSAAYFLSAEARERIARDIPHCRIIITLRDPVERLYSHYRKGCEEAYFFGTFEEILERRQDLLDWSRYAIHVRHWYSSFGRENVLVLIYEDLKSDPQRFLDRVTDFIGMDPISLATVPSAFERVNSIARMPWSRHLAVLARTVRDRLERRGAFGMLRFVRRAGLRTKLFGGGAPFPPLDPDTEALLRREFEAEIRDVEGLLGIELPQWRGSAGQISA